jgi:hypothetical protein
MAEEPTKDWPRFELVHFPEPIDFPHDLAAPLLEQGAPKALLARYQVADTLTLVNYPPFGEYVQFGRVAISDSVCFDPNSQQIVVISHLPALPVSLVNSTQSQFIESIRFVIDRFPFDKGYAGDINSETYDVLLEKVADELAAGLRRIDPAALSDGDTFWADFLDSVIMGDWATARIVADESE